MILGVDHLVIAVADPDVAAADLEREAGVAFTGGGRHEHAGTFNRLAFLGDTYLELIGVFDDRLVRANPSFAVGAAALAVLEAGREGLATYALATDDCAAEVARLRAGGSPIDAAVAGSRTRPDGEVVRWITAFPPLGPQEPPFLIEHESVGAEWGAAAREARATFRQPVGGVVRLASVELPVPDVAAAAARYQATLGILFDGAGRADVGGQAIVLRAAAGDAPEDGSDLPVVDLRAEAGTAPLDIVRFGVRWRR